MFGLLSRKTNKSRPAPWAARQAHLGLEALETRWVPTPIVILNVSYGVVRFITLDGTLDFETKRGQHFTVRPGDILLAEDTAGSGHSWKLVGDEPWRRAYVILPPNVVIPFVPTDSQRSQSKE